MNPAFLSAIDDLHDAVRAAALQQRIGRKTAVLREALAWPLLESACRILDEMASFESAGVADKE